MSKFLLWFLCMMLAGMALIMWGVERLTATVGAL